MTSAEGRRVPIPGEVWRRYDATEVRLTAPVSERMLDLAGLAPGMRVLDLATGRGEPALRAAHRVGPRGFVVGVDSHGESLQMAKERAEREGLSNLELRSADAALSGDLPQAHFHAATVRWGLMYMADPVAALANARRALLPTGVLVAAFWAEPERVAYYSLPTRLLERYLSLPAIDPEAPGQFRYAELERIERDLERAGFRLDHAEEMEIPVFEAETAGEVVAWLRAVGPALAQLLSGLPERDQRAWEREFEIELEHSRVSGLIRMGGVTRIVRARPV